MNLCTLGSPLTQPCVPCRSTYRRSLRPTPEQLQSLGLQKGPNELEFEVVSGGVQGAVTVACSLYLWSHNAKIVVSDVDGTITKSDVLGHIMYMVGRDWTHEGVARLFSNIKVCHCLVGVGFNAMRSLTSSPTFGAGEWIQAPLPHLACGRPSKSNKGVLESCCTGEYATAYGPSHHLPRSLVHCFQT